MMGSTSFRWIPKMQDSFIPFTLGFSEIYAVHNITSEGNNLYLWFYSVSLFCLIGFWAYHNMYHRARQYQENLPIFERLGKLPKFTEISVFFISIVFAIIGIISKKLSSNLTAQFIMASVSLILIVIFFVRGVHCWNKIIGKSFRLRLL